MAQLSILKAHINAPTSDETDRATDQGNAPPPAPQGGTTGEDFIQSSQGGD